MRALFAFSIGEFSGCELATVTSLVGRPADVECRAVLLSPGQLESELAGLGIPTAVLPPRSTGARDRLRLGRALDRTIQAFGPDVIHASGNKAAFLALPVSKLRGIPLVWYKCDSRYDVRGARALARNCRRVIALSRAAGAVIPASKLSVVYPPVRLSPDYRVPEARPAAVIGSIGRLEPWKGHEVVIAAAAMLHDEMPELTVLIAGAEVPYAPGYRAVLRCVARKHGIEDRVEFLGPVAQIEDLLSRLTVLVAASYAGRRGRGGEAFGLAVAEASWAGLPVVATRTGGLPEHVKDGVTGLLVPPRQPENLAAAIRRVLQNPDWATAMGEAGAQQARVLFDPDKATRQLFDVLTSCAGPAQQSSRRHPCNTSQASRN